MYFMIEKRLLSVIFAELLFTFKCNGLDIQTALENELFENINIEGLRNSKFTEHERGYSYRW